MGGCFQVLLCLADGTLAVQRLRRFRADIGIGNRDAALCQHILSAEFFYPPLPVFTAHNLYGSGSFFVVRRFRRNFGECAGKRIEGFAGERLSERLECRTVGNAGFRIGTHGACHAVYN